ncbi:unnamed protein product, partial [Mesorhabditis spiculigera]
MGDRVADASSDRDPAQFELEERHQQDVRGPPPPFSELDVEGNLKIDVPSKVEMALEKTTKIFCAETGAAQSSPPIRSG